MSIKLLSVLVKAFRVNFLRCEIWQLLNRPELLSRTVAGRSLVGSVTRHHHHRLIRALSKGLYELACKSKGVARALDNLATCWQLNCLGFHYLGSVLTRHFSFCLDD